MAARRGGVDRLDVDTAAYFSEMSATFATLTDPEEAALLAGSALAEVQTHIPIVTNNTLQYIPIFPGPTSIQRAVP